jgi:hypothetical protein
MIGAAGTRGSCGSSGSFWLVPGKDVALVVDLGGV